MLPQILRFLVVGLAVFRSPHIIREMLLCAKQIIKTTCIYSLARKCHHIDQQVCARTRFLKQIK